MRVAVLGGGRSSEHDVSLRSAAAVREGLAEAGHEALEVEIARDGRWSLDGAPVLIEPGAGLLEADVAFPVLHGPFGEDGTIQGLLETADIPYVGAGVLASAACLDKVVFKDLMAHAGMPQVDYVGLLEHEGRHALERLGLPVFVKPAHLGSSVGITKVEEGEALEAALDEAFRHDPLVIVEAMSRGIEVECSVIGNARRRASLPGEIIARAGWYDFEAKYTAGGMELIVPARIDADVSERVRALACEVYERVGCAGLARVDFFVEGSVVLVNELNTMPGFTPTSVFAKLFEASGVGYAQLLDELIELALERHRRERSYRF
ncbi:MAG: D-alanine--D-alanine ligase family protein [Thermoleophilaceae bacterium]